MDNVRSLVDRWWAALEAGRLDAAQELMAADCELRMPGVQVRGREAIRAVLEPFVTAFPNMKHTTLRSVEAADTVVVELRIEMTHSGPFVTPQGTVPATGKKVVLHSCDVVTARDGRFVSWHAYFDNVELMGQLGLLPPPPGP